MSPREGQKGIIMKHRNYIHSILLAVGMSVCLGITVSVGALSGPAGTKTTVLYHADNGTLSGLCVVSNLAYFGRATTIRSYDLDTDSTRLSGNLPANVNISLVDYLNDVLYTSIGSSWSWPYPNQWGYIDNSLMFNELYVINGIFDSALHPDGTMYLVTNPDPSNYGTGYIGTGSCIYAYTAAGAMTHVATLGGDSGGLACDSKGNLYYAYQAAYPAPSQIVRFTPQQLQAGNLTIAEAEVVVDMAAGYLAFDAHDYLYATVGWGNAVNKYDPDSGRLISVVATDDAAGYGVGKFVWSEITKSFVTLFTDWAGFQGYLYELIRPYIKSDFDRDGLADHTIYDAVQGNWITLLSGSDQRITRHWGWSATQPVSADYDGDSFADLAVYWPAGGMWYIEYSSDGSVISLNWGWADATPVPADYDGDGITDIAVYGTDGSWTIRYSADESLHALYWGWADAILVPADYDGDSKTDPAVYSDGQWYIYLSSDASLLQVDWGWADALPVPGDYDGDGIDDVAVYGQNGTWFIRYSSNGSMQVINWGWDAATPVPCDYDGDGRCDIAVQDAQQKQYILQSRTGTGRIVNLGFGAGD